MTVAALEAVVGSEALAAPTDDRWAALAHPPETVVSPTSAEEAAAVLAWAGSEGVTVLIAASGRRMRPRAVPSPYVGLTPDRLTGMELYEPADMTFTARAGTSVAAVSATLAENRQWLPFDPPALSERTLGGLVACGESGPLQTGYGAIRNHVLGATVVTGDGRVLRLGGRVVKNVAGFDLLKPLVGSRGRLAFITSVCLRTFPEPAVERLLALSSDDEGTVVGAANRVGTAPVMPVASVLRWSRSGPCTLSVRLHGAAETVEADQATIEAHVGVTFDTTDGPRRIAPGTPPDTGTEITATVLPGYDNLARLLARFRDGGAAWITVDSYGGRLRAGFDELDGAGLERLRDGAEEMDGALAVERAPDHTLGAHASQPSTAEAALAARVAGAFDPEGVLWPT